MKTRPISPIRLQLRELAQLFNAMDPSPLQDRDLDAEAEDFIVNWARESPPGHELDLVIQVGPGGGLHREQEVEQSVRHYFSERAAMKRREFRLLMRRGRTSLLVGLLFLATCLFLGEMLGQFSEGTLASILKESLTIGGWVAMWRPLEIYLYNWWPLREERRVFDRLSRMRVHVMSANAAPEEHLKLAA